MRIQNINFCANEKKSSYLTNSNNVPSEIKYPVITIQRKDEPKVPEKEGGGFWSGMRNIAVKFNKATVVADEFSSALIFGSFKGAIIAGLAFIGINKINYLKNMKILASRDAKIAASAGVGLLSLAISIFNAKLNVNQRMTEVDFRWNVKKPS